MERWQDELVELLVRADAIRFGEFTTKSGRPSPWFVNLGRVRSGRQLERLGSLYARAIVERLGAEVDLLFGPAYKGIPIAVATGIALAREHGIDVGVAFDRKEAKDHGEGGVLVGHEPADGERVVLVEDVTTAGTSVRRAVPLLRASADVRIAGLVVAVDRGERPPDRPGEAPATETALRSLERELGAPCFALVGAAEILERLHGRAVDGHVLVDDATRARVEAHLARYGPVGTGELAAGSGTPAPDAASRGGPASPRGAGGEGARR